MKQSDQKNCRESFCFWSWGLSKGFQDACADVLARFDNDTEALETFEFNFNNLEIIAPSCFTSNDHSF